MKIDSRIQLEFAPLEGITTAAFRRAHSTVFPGADRYYTPFLMTGQNFLKSAADRREVDPQLNQDIVLIPQLMSNRSPEFLSAAGQLSKMGYREINLNLGCPSKTVVSKHRGAGFLEKPWELERFFTEVFDGLPAIVQQTGSPISVSVKTRIGMLDPEEGLVLIRLFNQFPISELIIHPRVQNEFYTGNVHLDLFREMFRMSRIPICYNGEIRTAESALRIRKLCASIEEECAGKDSSPLLCGIMIGRGAVRNPALFRMLRGGDAPSKEEIRRFLSEFLTQTALEIPEENNRLPKLKEVWAHLGLLFEGSEKHLKKIRKAKSLMEYQAAANLLISECRIIPE